MRAKRAEDRRAGRRDQFRLDVGLPNRFAFQQFDRCRGRHRNRAMRAGDKTCAERKRRDINRVRAEQMQPDCRADNIHDGV